MQYDTFGRETVSWLRSEVRLQNWKAIRTANKGISHFGLFSLQTQFSSISNLYGYSITYTLNLRSCAIIWNYKWTMTYYITENINGKRLQHDLKHKPSLHEWFWLAIKADKTAIKTYEKESVHLEKVRWVVVQYARFQPESNRSVTSASSGNTTRKKHLAFEVASAFTISWKLYIRRYVRAHAAHAYWW